MNIDQKYKAWDAWAKQQDEAPEGTATPADVPKLSKEDLKDVKFSLGKPLTEEEFKEQRKKNGGRIVASKHVAG